MIDCFNKQQQTEILVNYGSKPKDETNLLLDYGFRRLYTSNYDYAMIEVAIPIADAEGDGMIYIMFYVFWLFVVLMF
jgi:hypothetical protein